VNVPFITDLPPWARPTMVAHVSFSLAKGHWRGPFYLFVVVFVRDGIPQTFTHCL